MFLQGQKFLVFLFLVFLAAIVAAIVITAAASATAREFELLLLVIIWGLYLIFLMILWSMVVSIHQKQGKKARTIDLQDGPKTQGRRQVLSQR